MENNLRFIVEYLQYSAKLSLAFSDKKLSSEEVRYVFQSTRRSGNEYLDLSDVYRLVGDVSQEQLFMIFKALDVGRRGLIYEKDLLMVLSRGGDGCQLDTIGKRFEQLMRSLLNYNEKLKKWKMAMNFTTEIIKVLFKLVLTRCNDHPFTVTQLIQVLKQTQPHLCNPSIQQQLQKIFYFVTSYVQLEDFISVFAVEQTNQISDHSHEQSMAQTTFRTNLNHPQTNYQYHNQPHYSTNQWKQNQSIRNWRTSKPTVQSFETNSLSHNFKSPTHFRTLCPTTNNKRYSSSFGIKNNSYATSTPIDEQRQQLRKCSMERKNLMQGYLAQKQHNYNGELKTNKPWYSGNPNSNKLKKHTHFDKLTLQFKKNADIEPNAIPTTPKFKTQNYQYFDNRNTNTPSTNINSHYTHTYDPRQSNKSYNSHTYNSHTYNSHTYNSHTYEPGHSSSKSQNSTYLCAHHSQKQNILRKAQKQANKKIEEIERRARIKVLERKSSITDMKWFK